MSDTALTVIGTVVVALIGAVVSIYVANRPRRDQPVTPDGKPFQGSPNDAAMIALAEVRRLAVELEKVQEKLTDLETWRESFSAAVRRYLTKLTRAWAHTGPMPTPDDADLDILAPVLPKPGSE